MPDPTQISNLDVFLREYLLYIAIGVTAGIGGFLLKMWRCIQKQERRGWRQSQAFMLLVELIDDQTEDLHPNVKVHDIKDRIQRILKDDNGEF